LIQKGVRDFGRRSDAQLRVDSDDGTDPNEDRKFSPPVVLDEEVRIIQGDPDPSRISTSYVERSNLTIRMGNRRFTRLTNGLSKKVENHAASVALQMMFYNFARPHDLGAAPRTVIAFGNDTYRLALRFIPSSRYARLVGVTHYSHYISKEEYRRRVLAQLSLDPT
jgi:hypothetical protein